jgi:hypothetical protein
MAKSLGVAAKAKAEAAVLPISCDGRRRSLVCLAGRHTYISFFTSKGIYYNAQLV